VEIILTIIKTPTLFVIPTSDSEEEPAVPLAPAKSRFLAPLEMTKKIGK
jgi:hypothetical protein